VAKMGSIAMTSKYLFSLGTCCSLALILAGCSSENSGPNISQAQAPSANTAPTTDMGSSDGAPQFEVDISWPKQLPNDWILGQVSGIAVDSQDNIWIIQRPRSLTAHELGAVQNPPATDCCYPAPSVIAFNPAGEVIQAWGGPTWNQEQSVLDTSYGSANIVDPAGWDLPDNWPTQEHGIFIDHEDNVWIGGNGSSDHVVMKFTTEGEHLLTIGQWNQTSGSNDTQHLGRPADVTVDIETNEAYIADGYLNRRVVVFDANTGEYKRHWGAFGNIPNDTVDISNLSPVNESWHNPVHAVRISRDGLVYVADRGGSRIHVFNKDGTFVQEGVFAPWTIVQGAAWDIELSSDPDQQWLFAADGANMKVWILRRDDMEVVGSFGHGGRQAGQFNWVHNITADSFGNLYTAEVNTGKRIQKFVPVAINQ
tara:strand:+ start:4186 stop:5457 length:1272 start_codon:yes stop_codon:yes gene_type:complete